MAQSKMQALAAAIALAALSATSAPAQDKDCAGFKWRVARERGWFATPTQVASGATIEAGQGYAVALAPEASVVYRMAPERAAKTGSFGATLEAPHVGAPGPYQVSLSADAWIDVVQDGARLKSTAFTGQKSCPGVRKSVRFDLKASPLTLQISNAPAATINLSIAPAQ